MTTGRLPSVEGGIQPTIVDAKGDLIVATAADTVSRIAVGSNNQVLTADSSTSTGVKWATPASGGKVVQIVYADYTTSTSSSTTSYADTGLTASITPTSASNDILVFVHQNGTAKTGSNTNSSINLKLFRGATEIAYIAQAALYNDATGSLNGTTLSIAYKDSPATTSSTTYKTQFANFASAASVTLQANSNRSTIVLMEVTP